METKLTDTETNIQKTGEMAAGIMASESGDPLNNKSVLARIKNFNILDLDQDGKVGVPILLYFLGVPGGLVILLWLFFFRGK
ncbi:MAG: hypothetical protein H7301_05360 [Cryobacterium sp.]|nr:hypothetical protein [Oligoflexia bacterium]